MNKYRKSKKAKAYYNLVIGDAEKLKGLFEETDIHHRYLIAPDLTLVSWLSLLLCAVYDGSLRLEWGTETTSEIIKSFISTTASQLPNGKYKDNPDELNKLFLSITGKIKDISSKEKDYTTQYLRLAEYTLKLIFYDSFEVEKYPSLLEVLVKEYQAFLATIRSRVCKNKKNNHNTYYRYDTSDYSKSLLVSDKYKDIAPKLSEFGLMENEIDSIKMAYQEWEEYLHDQGKIASQITGKYESIERNLKRGIVWGSILLFFLGGCIYGIVDNGSLGRIIGYAFTAVIIVSPLFIGVLTAIAWLIIEKVREKALGKFYNTYKKFPQHDKKAKISQYEIAVNEHEYWQARKKQGYWMNMSGRTFEKEISDLFLRRGYKTHLCQAGGDGGADIFAEKNGKKIIIQCKAHSSKISPSIARDLLGTVIARNASEGYLITLNGGTSGTIEFCEKNGLILWDTDNPSPNLRQVARDAADKAGIPLQEGVYCYCTGPQFETPAEIRAFRILGGDAAGMSTVTEALTAAHCGMKVLALSLITNMAAGMQDVITTAEVDETAEATAEKFQALMLEIVSRL